MLSNRPMKGITASPPPKSFKTHREENETVSSSFWEQRDSGSETFSSIIYQKDPVSSSGYWRFPPYFHNLSKGNDGAVSCSVRGGWRPEWWQSAGSFSSDREDMITIHLPGKCYEGCSDDHCSVTHWWYKEIQQKCNEQNFFFVKERHVYSNTKVLTGSYSPHYFPGIHGAGGVTVRG